MDSRASGEADFCHVVRAGRRRLIGITEPISSSTAVVKSRLQHPALQRFRQILDG
jgi:hypothetical protein